MKAIVIVALVLSFGTVGTALAGKTDTSSAQVGNFPIAGGGDADGASIMSREKEGVGYTLTTRGLAPNAPYTNWFVSFNDPKKCVVKCACGEADFANPRVEIGVFWATGKFSDANGQATFSAYTPYGVLPDGDGQVPFDEFANPIESKSEVHVIVQSHGPTVGDGEAQLTTFFGGCPPNPEIDPDPMNGGNPAAGCVDVQFAVHPNPKCK